MQLSTLWLSIGAAAVGLLVGSFLNVVIYRLPRDESIAFPASHCPRCDHRLSLWENVPLLSWLVLRGRCRWCAAGISLRYPLVEASTAALFCLAALEFGPSEAAVAACILSSALIAVTFIDLDHLLILDRLTLCAASAGLLLAAVSGRLLGSLEGAAFGCLLFGVIYVLTRGAGMGLGDVKLAAAVGLYLGLAGSVAAFASAFV
ncbi:MAG: prepilin peptidase, partial [Candidatus Eremiobacteraeota bacterium]|nr:prepilin peptidase [Candidatus Eremiobacteraeota bacterium]